MRTCLVRDEELTSIGRGSFIRHADNAARIVAECGAEFILKGFVPDGVAAFAFAGGVRGSTLDHKIVNVAMEVGVVVAAGGAKSEEVV